MSNLGVADDPRTDEQKAKDYQHSEIAGAIPINWGVKDPSIWKKYSIREQDGSYSCCSQGAAKAFEVKTGVVTSAHPLYRARANYPNGGMWLADLGNIAVKRGTTSEASDPSQFMNEDQMNLPATKPNTVKAAIYVFVNFKDIDAIAEAIELAGSAPTTFNGFLDEWTNVPVSNGKTTGMNLQHCVCAVDYFLFNGPNGIEKAILIDDSWGHATSIGNGGQRVITESYLKARASGGMYFLNFGPTNQKPQHTFTKYLNFGMVNDPDVKALQQILAYEGLFPLNISGNYGNITAGAVYKWQVKHNVSTLADLNTLYGKHCGPKTIAMLNQLYG